MSASSDPTSGSSSVVPSVPVKKERTAPIERTRPKLLPPYAVVLHNDDVNCFAHVVSVLMKVFRYGRGRALWLALRTHVAGRCVVWTGSLEVAELKVEQVRAAGPDPQSAYARRQPLNATAEALT